jgi:hypothetical protein
MTLQDLLKAPLDLDHTDAPAFMEHVQSVVSRIAVRRIFAAT